MSSIVFFFNKNFRKNINIIINKNKQYLKYIKNYLKTYK